MEVGHARQESFVRTGIVVGIASALLAGLVVSIGGAQAAGDGPASTAPPADVIETTPPVEADPPGGTVEVAVRPDTPVNFIAPVNRALSAVNAREPARRVSQETSVDFDRLVLVGDSLADATAPVIRFVTPGKAFVRKYWGGTAPCDWIDDDLEATPTTVVVITFSGNNLTTCMLDGTGAPLIDEPLVGQYRVDVGVLIDHARAAGAWVVLVGQPLRHPRFDADLEVEGINAMYREYASTIPHVSYVDAGHLVETTDGHYTDRLPCIQFDTDCAPDGTTMVRGDGVHFCPVVDVVPCPVWSSGAFRFGLGIASAASDPANFD
jgi:hypothetical protein